MDRRLIAIGLAIASFPLTGCDPRETKAKSGAAQPSFDASEPKNAPEPVVFGARVQPEWRAGPEPAVSASAVSLRAAGVSPDAGDGDQTGRKVFDGSWAPTSAPVVRPALAGGPDPIVLTNRKMSIDTDGLIADPVLARQIKRRDRWHQDSTSYLYANGRSLDATKVPYIVLPLSYHGAELGDLALVEYRGRKVWAVCGDRGPRFGEASAAAAQALGINPDGRSGGVGSGVTYTVFPGSSGARPRDEAELAAFIDRSAPSLYARLGRNDETRVASLR
ncbi:MAG: hypothetical protein HY077_14780 [Elusimicrobia bacterium]|nr:hypothetical protein [Elusimicrobiota bacterium]